ncbi:Os10g0538950 [Oryza sativa Japonica Group]|uniref:Os10g0538950 protein n=1 Tax=Oryza sativa subsp. japonica TaxID=39947 RepID=A0A0P0XWZ7_ORYSJ|nr:hypothetical protein EE612_052508 [Oryza sativa]BAT11845.1 Os10g0538950 [Oryza sativa Japonica Group]
MDVHLLQASQDAHAAQRRRAQDRYARRVVPGVEQVARHRHRHLGAALEREHEVRRAAAGRRFREAEVVVLHRRRHRRRADGVRHRLPEVPVHAVHQGGDRRGGGDRDGVAALGHGDRRVAGSDRFQTQQVRSAQATVGRGASLDERRRAGALSGAGELRGGAEEQRAALPGVGRRQAVGERGGVHLRGERQVRPP